MAKLKHKVLKENATTTQTISISGHERNILVESAEKNGRSLSSEIMYRVKQTLQQEARI
jgi:hypothetical protein